MLLKENTTKKNWERDGFQKEKGWKKYNEGVEIEIEKKEKGGRKRK